MPEFNVGFVCLFPVLAQRGILRDRSFINYLKYLLYWKEPEYAKFLKYGDVFDLSLDDILFEDKVVMFVNPSVS